MTTTRRDFLERIAGGALLLGSMPEALYAASLVQSGPAIPAETWDLTWVNRLTGKYKAVMDVPEVDSAYGVWRATIWARQYAEVMVAKPADCSSVLVMRHNGIALAMTQAFWDKYELAKKHKPIHPVTEAPTDRNPALMSSTRNEQPAMFDDFALDKFIARGGVALACNLAFGDCVARVAAQDKLSEDAARTKAISMMVPGVILQPSGIFAAIRAQQAGCAYVRAS